MKISSLWLFLNLEWWEYFIIIVLVFMAFLFVNYVIKKFNEARIEDRLTRLLQKADNNQATQIQELSLEIEANNKNTPSNDMLDKCKPQLAGISLVFNKEDNILQEVRTRQETSDQDAKIWDLDKITKMTHGNKENALHKLTSIKSNKLLLKTENTKTTVPRTIVIKDSKDAIDKTKIIVPSLRRHKTDETMYMKIKNTFFKHNKLEPKAVEKVTDIGSVFGKDKIPYKQSNKLNLHTSQKSEDTPEKVNSLTKVNTSKSKVPTVDASHQVKDTLSNPNSFFKNDTLETKPLNAKDTHSTSILDEDSQIACHDFDTPEIQFQDISQKTKETLSPKICDSVMKLITLQAVTSSAETPNTNNILDANTKKSAEGVSQKRSGNILTNGRKDLKLPANLPKRSEDIVSNEINNSVLLTDRITQETPVQESAKHEDKITQAGIGSILIRDKLELKSSSAEKLTKLEGKLPQNRSDHISITKIEDEKLSNVKESIITKKTLSTEKSASTSINEKMELKTQSKEGTTKSEGKLSPKKSKVTFCSPGGSGVPPKETSQKSEELLSQENSYSTTTTNNSQQDVSPDNSENNLSKHNNSREDSTSSSITIGLLMTEISLKPNKVYESSDSLKTNKSDANINNPFLVNIPKIENNVTDDTLSNSQPEPSEISTITKEIFFRKEADFSLQDVEIKVKPITIKANIVKQPVDIFTSSTISEPHTSVSSQERDETITHNLSDTSTNRYNQKIKKFWESFTTRYST